MVSVVLVTSLVVALTADRRIEETLAPTERERQLYYTRGLAQTLEVSIAGVRANTLVAAGAGPVSAILDPQASAARVDARDQLVRVFRAMLEANPEYLQIRVISGAGDGLELVRVERSGHGQSVRTVPDAQLQAKGNRAYVRSGLQTPPGQVYVSRIELNREHDAVQTPHIPVLRAVTPVARWDGATAGIVVINVDMRKAFDAVRASGAATYVVDDAGNYLVHPDRRREFGRDLGNPYRVQDEFPDVVPVLDHAPAARDVTRDGDEVVVAVAPVEIEGRSAIAVVSTRPSSNSEAMRNARWTTLTLALATAAGAAFIAFFVARSITRPLNEMTVAAAGLLEDEHVVLPTERSGEIGVLARALAHTRELSRAHRAAERGEQERFRAVIEASPSAMLVVDRDREITFANTTAETLFGFERAELLGQKVEMLVPEPVRARHPGDVAKFLETPSARAMGVGRELFAVRKDGQTVAVEVGLSPLELSGEPCVLATIVDIGERRRVEEWFRRIVAAAPNAKLVVDRSSRISMVNPAAETLFGYNSEELVGQPVDCLVPGSVRSDHPDYVRSFFADPKARPMGAGRDLFGRRKDGTEVPIEIGLAPVEGLDGPAVLASIIDITERKRFEEDLRRSNAELEQFAYVASHDLQEPLRMVANYTELLAERYRGQLDEKADKYIFYASDGARRMKTLVTDLLAYSRVGSQGKPLEPVRSGAALETVIVSMETVIAETGATIEHESLPRVMADPVQLRQLFQNLLSNAIKFHSDEPPKIVVDAVARGFSWTFSVADNGIGIEMQHAARIFQMFQRLHEIGKFEGSGIGLAISKRIVERHGGRLWVESEPGKGTTFYFTLTAAKEEVA